MCVLSEAGPDLVRAIVGGRWKMSNSYIALVGTLTFELLRRVNLGGKALDALHVTIGKSSENSGRRSPMVLLLRVVKMYCHQKRPVHESR